MIERDDVTGIVLCGGLGARMGGRDKPLALLHAKPLVAHVVARLAPQVARVVISCGRNTEHYARWGDAVVVDEVAGEGPLRGIATALGAIDTPYAFVCPGDAPSLSTSIVATLSRAWRDGTPDACVPFDGARTQHLFLLLRAALQEDLRRYLDCGGRAVHGWIQALNTFQVDASHVGESFRNVNTDEDLRALNAKLAQEQVR
jgi:molybdopterin-guanine dinucleotide biosynthesis protein A